MSFRKRNEPLAGPRGVPGVTPVPPIARVPLDRGAGRAPVPSTGLSGRMPATIGKNSLQQRSSDLTSSPVPSIGVRPSSVSSQPTVSTGCADLDKILVHQGLPLSNSILIEESGTTDFASVLLRNFAAQGVMHNRVEKNTFRSHVIVIGPPAAWAKDLPGEYKGSSKEQKKAKIARDSSQVSVANMAEKDLKIAWRYGLNGAKKGHSDESEPNTEAVDEHYVTQFDITQRLLPGASAQDITFVPISTSYAAIVNQVAKIAELHAKQGKTVRIAVPGFLNPSMYPPACSAPNFVIPFVHSLRGLLARVPSAVLMMSLALDLYPRNTLVTHMIETLVDGVVHLQPFNPDMAALIERAYKNEPAKIQQGLVNIIKVPLLSERGMMMVTNGEYAFKNGRKKFEIEEWGIPVEDAEEPAQTKQNIDF
ncbi:hypothetical protein OXX69_006600 [Metschnikowia pulcherrima]